MNRCLGFKKHTYAFSFSSPPASAAVTGITDVSVIFFATNRTGLISITDSCRRDSRFQHRLAFMPRRQLAAQ